MALVASLTVFIDVLEALTLLPALLGLIGERIVSSKTRNKTKTKDSTNSTFANHWIKGIIKFRWLAFGLIIVIFRLDGYTGFQYEFRNTFRSKQ